MPSINNKWILSFSGIGHKYFPRRILVLLSVTIGNLVLNLYTPDVKGDGVPLSLSRSVVKILTPGSPGSGVIVSKAGRNYTVLTDKHVIEAATKGEELVVTTWDRRTHSARIVAKSKILDLAELEFTDNEEYPLVSINKDPHYPVNGYVVGYKAAGDMAQSEACLIDNQGTTPNARPGGYAISYICNTYPGMSGGAILDNKYSLIGIHGQADIYTDLLANQLWRSRLSLGIPISFWLKDQDLGGTGNQKSGDFPSQMSTAYDFYLRSSYRSSIGYLAGALYDAEEAVKMDPKLAYIGQVINLQILLHMDVTAISSLKRLIALDSDLWYAKILLARLQFNSSGSVTFLNQMEDSISKSMSKYEKALGYCWLQEGYAKIGNKQMAHNFSIRYNSLVAKSSRTDGPAFIPPVCNEL